MTEVSPDELEYVGFWLRVWASVIDTLLALFVLYPLLSLLPGSSSLSDIDLQSLGGFTSLSQLTVSRGPMDFLLSWVAPAIAVLLFWIARQATPGKMAIGARIVDARSGSKPSAGQLIGRYLGYYVSMFPCFLGLIWVGFDGRKQGWHDKLAGTVVVRRKAGTTRAVSFGG